MCITNSNFSAEEILLLNFILSQPFSKRNEVINHINKLKSEEIVRDHSPYFKIWEFRTKDILPGYNSGMRVLISVQVQHANGCAPTVFTLYEKDGLPFEYEIYNADSSKMDMDRILEGKLIHGKENHPF